MILTLVMVVLAGMLFGAWRAPEAAHDADGDVDGVAVTVAMSARDGRLDRQERDAVLWSHGTATRRVVHLPRLPSTAAVPRDRVVAAPSGRGPHAAVPVRPPPDPARPRVLRS